MRPYIYSSGRDYGDGTPVILNGTVSPKRLGVAQAVSAALFLASI